MIDLEQYKQFVLDNYSLSCPKLAKLIGCKTHTLQKKIETWRALESHKFPVRSKVHNKIPVGGTTVRLLHGKMRELRKDADGCYRVVDKLIHSNNRRIDIQYILDNADTKTYEEFAEHFGVRISSVKSAIAGLRKQGHKIPFRAKRYNIGDVSLRVNSDGVMTRFIKTEGGWRYGGVVEKVVKTKLPSTPKSEKVPKVKAVKKTVRTDGNRRLSKAINRFATRQQDMTNMVWVKKDHKTYVLRDKSKEAV